MTAQKKRLVLALASSELFPPSVRESLISDPAFRNSYGIRDDALISFSGAGASVLRSSLFDRIREILANPLARPAIKDEAGKEWRLVLLDSDNERRIVLSDGEHRFLLPDFSVLSPDPAERVKGFERDASDVNLPQQATNAWNDILASRALADDEVGELHTEIKDTPIRVASLISAEMETGKGNLSTLVPRSERYFERLVGDYRQNQNIADHAQASSRDHIRELMSWRAYDGFLLSLLLASHSSVSSVIDVGQLDEPALIQAYEWLLKEGDRISQIGAIEVGLSVLDKRPKIERFLLAMIEQIRDDNDDERGRFGLLSALIMLVDGELARTKILSGKPVFGRRLASIAQASLIERCAIKSHLEIPKFTEWAAGARSQFFYLQAMADLRREPRWLPEYVSPRQLKAEFLGRILGAARQNTAKIRTPAVRELLFGEGPEGIMARAESPFPYLPGPLEGGLMNQAELPEELSKAIEKQLSGDVLQPGSFVALLNSALFFRLEEAQAQLAAKALRVAKHQLRQADTEGMIMTVLRGLATVAAITRSGELAEEVRTLARRWRYQSSDALSADAAMRIGLIAAAAHSELTSWCEFVGQWLTELAFQELRPDEIKELHSDILCLCSIVPELWRTCGRAEAALST